MINIKRLIELFDKVKDAGYSGIDYVGLANYQEREIEAKDRLHKTYDSAMDELTSMIETNLKTVIYTVTTIRIDGYRSRTPGWFPTLKDAIDAVLTNSCDIHENYYSFAVVEEVPAGMYAFGEKGRAEFWFRWSPEHETYEAVPKPDKFLRSVGWGIG
jgi:hypothetical protein